LLARNIATRCKTNGKVRNWLSINGPNMGVSDIPGCLNGFFCKLINSVVRSLVYMGLAQHHIGPAGYFRDPAHMVEYVNGSVFLPDENNERGTEESKAALKEKFTSLNGVMLVLGTQDITVYPKESEWFQTLDDKDRKVVPLEDSDFYKNDYIGLKQLNDAGKV